jgi:hypothetical protein
MRTLLTVALLIGPSVAFANIRTVELQSSSVEGANEALRVFDSDQRTAWCASKSDKSPTLTIVFKDAVANLRLRIETKGFVARRRLATTVTVQADDHAPVIISPSSEANSFSGTWADLGATPIHSIRLEVNGGYCIPEIVLEEGRERLSAIALPPADLEALTAALKQIGKAMEREAPDPAALAKLVVFPLVVRIGSTADEEGPMKVERVVMHSVAELIDFQTRTGSPSLMEGYTYPLTYASEVGHDDIVLETSGGNEQWRMTRQKGHWVLTGVGDTSQAPPDVPSASTKQ